MSRPERVTSYRKTRVSSFASYPRMKATLAKLNAEAPDGVWYEHLVSETAPYRPHQIIRYDAR